MEPNVALITGGARGIGKGIALDLATRGWSLPFAIEPANRRRPTRPGPSSNEEAKGSPFAATCPIPRPAGIWSGRFEGHWGKIDVLVNGAGPYHRVNVFDETPEGWADMFTNNLHPIFIWPRRLRPA